MHNSEFNLKVFLLNGIHFIMFCFFLDPFTLSSNSVTAVIFHGGLISAFVFVVVFIFISNIMQDKYNNVIVCDFEAIHLIHNNVLDISLYMFIS